MPRAVRRQTLVRARPRKAGASAMPAGSLLVATDFSPQSRRALDAAAALAKDLGVGIVLAHAAADRREALPGTRRRTRQVIEATDEVAELSAWAESARADGLPVAAVEAPGDPAEVILQAAKDHQCSMVVLAASGKGLARTLLLGSTAREVLRRSRRPVLVVPHRAGKPREGEGRPGKAIVAGLDLSSESEAACGVAFALAKDLGAVVRLVHVVELPVPFTALPYPDGALPPEVVDRMEQEGAAALARQASKARRHKVGAVPVQHVGQAASALLADAKQAGASLIVVGSHGKSPGRRFFVGSVAQTLAQFADRPVLVVPDPDATESPGGWAR